MWFIIFLALLTTCGLNVNGSFQRVCYLIGDNGNPHVKRISNTHMQWSLCTHVIFAFSSITNGTITASPALTDYIQQMNSNTSAQHDVKLMISVAGPDFTLVRSDVTIKRYVVSPLNQQHSAFNHRQSKQIHRFSHDISLQIPLGWNRYRLGISEHHQ